MVLAFAHALVDEALLEAARLVRGELRRGERLPGDVLQRVGRRPSLWILERAAVRGLERPANIRALHRLEGVRRARRRRREDRRRVQARSAVKVVALCAAALAVVNGRRAREVRLPLVRRVEGRLLDGRIGRHV